MLTHVLAIAVGLGSITLYLAAFFFPEVHRKHDFFWSGVGCFYALVLWVDAGQISATEFWGHLASVLLVAWFGWQTLTLRRKRTPRDLQTPLNDDSWQAFGQDIASISVSWLKRTPLGRFLEDSGDKVYQPMTKGGFRASSLKQVDYEFLDELPHHPSGTSKDNVLQVLPAKSRATASTGAQTKPNLPMTRPWSASLPDQKSESISQKTKRVKPSQKPVTLLQKGIVLKDWLVDVITATTKPKPKKPVIVIPPRESSSSEPSKRVESSDTSDAYGSQPSPMASPGDEISNAAKAASADSIPSDTESSTEIDEPAMGFDSIEGFGHSGEGPGPATTTITSQESEAEEPGGNRPSGLDH
jgi:hypothetical protein